MESCGRSGVDVAGVIDDKRTFLVEACSVPTSSVAHIAPVL